MKVIKIENGMIIKEIGRQINRSLDTMNITLSTDVVYGDVWDSSKLELIRDMFISVTKREFPDLWNEFKDSTRDVIINHVFEAKALVDNLYLERLEELKQYDVDIESARQVATDHNTIWEEKHDIIKAKIEADGTYKLTDEEQDFMDNESPIDPAYVEKVQSLTLYELADIKGFSYMIDVLIKLDTFENQGFVEIIEV